MINARWAEIGAPGPPPILPASMVGKYSRITRGPRMLGDKPKADKKSGLRHVTLEENKFLNFWGKVAVDPYRKQSGISKVAGGLLQVASVVFPVMGVMQAVSSAGNVGMELANQKKDAQAIEDALAPAYAAEEARETAAAQAAHMDQMRALAALAPLSTVSPAFNAAPMLLPVQSSTPPKAAPKISTETALAWIAGGILLLGVIRR